MIFSQGRCNTTKIENWKLIIETEGRCRGIILHYYILSFSINRDPNWSKLKILITFLYQVRLLLIMQALISKRVTISLSFIWLSR